jgi:hypothetical protein
MTPYGPPDKNVNSFINPRRELYPFLTIALASLLVKMEKLSGGYTEKLGARFRYISTFT